MAEKIVKYRKLIVIIALLLLIPSFFGIISTRINYDMLTYLPEDMETVKGQNILMEEFGKGAFSFIIVDGMNDRETVELKKAIENTDHVDSVIWYDSIADISVPREILPQKYLDAFVSGDSTVMAVFFDSSTSAEETIEAVQQIRDIAGKSCMVAGMSALVADLKELCEQEEPVYVVIAVLLALAAMMIFMDSFVAPVIFLISIAVMIILNLGTNFFLGEISYITKALSAVLQLAVTMDYSIFLWHSYNDKRLQHDDKCKAMALAIRDTFSSVLGSSITTVAGFIALCFMSFTLGMDLGIVMAKGVILGVIGCVTLLPALILIFDRPLQKTKHRSLLPPMNGFAKQVVKWFPVIIIIFALLVAPSLYGYSMTNQEVYYNIGESLPDDLEYMVANSRLQDEFDIGSTHMLLVDADTPETDIYSMTEEIENVDGVKNVLGLESVIGPLIPEEFVPDSVRNLLESENYKLYLINSEYRVASDEVNSQLEKIQDILEKYDRTGMCIGEAACTRDMIEVTDTDFRIVNLVSIIMIFVIIALVERSILLPFILIAVIEFAIFVNLGLPHYMGESLPFIAPICISTIQLGATVDYAILMTTKYKRERIHGLTKQQSVQNALAGSVPSIIVSGAGLFAATFGVALYSDIDMISSICMLLARGALISMAAVIFILPSLLMLCDRIICATTAGMTGINRQSKKLKAGKNNETQQ